MYIVNYLLRQLELATTYLLSTHEGGHCPWPPERPRWPRCTGEQYRPAGRSCAIEFGKAAHSFQKTFRFLLPIKKFYVYKSR